VPGRQSTVVPSAPIGLLFPGDEGVTRGIVATDANNFAPRIGLAWRLDNWTVLRAGYGRFIVPASLANTERDDLGEIDLGGFTPTTVVPPVLAGIPQSYLSNPFPLGLDPIVGKKFGRNTNLGSAVSVDE